jgi:uridine kinase
MPRPAPRMARCVQHKRTSKTIPVCGRSTDVIIVDGLFILHWESVRGLCDVTLFTGACGGRAGGQAGG